MKATAQPGKQNAGYFVVEVLMSSWTGIRNRQRAGSMKKCSNFEQVKSDIESSIHASRNHKSAAVNLFDNWFGAAGDSDKRHKSLDCNRFREPIPWSLDIFQCC